MNTSIAVALAPSLILCGLIFLCRNFIATWIRRRTEHGFDEKIERLRTELRQSETRLMLELKAKQSELDSLGQTALSGAVNRRIALDNRRLQAVEQIWNSALELSSLKMAAAVAGLIKFDVATAEAKKNPQFREMIASFTKNVDFSNPPGANASKERPFVTSTVWAYYFAMSSILIYAVFQLKALQLGLDGKKYMSDEAISKLVSAALPHRVDYIKQYGTSGYYYLLDEIEPLLLEELRNMLEGRESDAAAIKTAADILKAARAIQTEVHSAIPNVIENSQ